MNRMAATRLKVLSLAILALAGAVPALAGSLRVAPTRLELPPDRRAVAFTVSNSGSAPTLVQLQVMQWSQSSGADEYRDTDDLIASPPIFTLEAGAEQTVRIGPRRVESQPLERAYRVFIQEVPPTTGRLQAQRLNVVLRIGVPLFLTPANAPASHVTWHLVCTRNGSPVFKVRNEGGRALRIDDLTLAVRGDPIQTYREQALYVLAGATRVLPLHGFSSSTRRVEIRGLAEQRELSGVASCE